MIDPIRTASTETRSSSEGLSPSRRVALLLSAVAMVAGAFQAVRLAWISDDAYISFRYARNLVEGLGLVFNAGERVEGYTNFLWTLWCALGLRLGATAEAWANAASIACYLATIALVAISSPAFRRRGPLLVPLAALMLAFHEDAAVFATSGLETALFTLLVVAGYVALVSAGSVPESQERSVAIRRSALAGFLLAAAALTRPDGVLFCVLGGAYLAAFAGRRLATALAYSAVLVAVGGPYALWKLAYYGDLLPNTFYAKSAATAWYGQGWLYAQLYFQKYPMLLAGPLLTMVSWAAHCLWPVPGRSAHATSLAPATLASLFALAYTAYVIRVGGDFMFARLLIPATPFYAIAVERALGDLAARWALRPRLAATFPAFAAAAVVASIGLAIEPFDRNAFVHGIVSERDYYLGVDRAGARRRGLELEELTRGLPIRGVVNGTQAIVAYYSAVPVAIEAGAGLTDATVARQRLERRGRVGHEKQASSSYLIDQRRAHFFLGWDPVSFDSLSRQVPALPLHYRSAKATVLTWDPPIMTELRRRGARVEDFTAILDRFIADMPSLPDSAVADMYGKSRRFYFDGFADPAREAPFLERLRPRAS